MTTFGFWCWGWRIVNVGYRIWQFECILYSSSLTLDSLKNCVEFLSCGAQFLVDEFLIFRVVWEAAGVSLRFYPLQLRWGERATWCRRMAMTIRGASTHFFNTWRLQGSWKFHAHCPVQPALMSGWLISLYTVVGFSEILKLAWNLDLHRYSLVVSIFRPPQVRLVIWRAGRLSVFSGFPLVCCWILLSAFLVIGCWIGQLRLKKKEKKAVSSLLFLFR